MPSKPEVSPLERIKHLLERGKKSLDFWAFTFAMMNSTQDAIQSWCFPLERVQHLLKWGKKSLDSWTITYGGISDLQEALKIQQAKGMGKVQMADTHICIARAFHKKMARFEPEGIHAGGPHFRAQKW
jgi:hypothetical protein